MDGRINPNTGNPKDKCINARGKTFDHFTALGSAFKLVLKPYESKWQQLFHYPLIPKPPWSKWKVCSYVLLYSERSVRRTSLKSNLRSNDPNSSNGKHVGQRIFMKLTMPNTVLVRWTTNLESYKKMVTNANFLGVPRVDAGRRAEQKPLSGISGGGGRGNLK
uniref:Uncharacterized protein n=1 Tax=Romanomermis culicivorax TaxID=13658 RepID=A0A915IPH8_ROMCU